MMRSGCLHSGSAAVARIGHHVHAFDVRLARVGINLLRGFVGVGEVEGQPVADLHIIAERIGTLHGDAQCGGRRDGRHRLAGDVDALQNAIGAVLSGRRHGRGGREAVCDIVFGHHMVGELLARAPSACSRSTRREIPPPTHGIGVARRLRRGDIVEVRRRGMHNETGIGNVFVAETVGELVADFGRGAVAVGAGQGEL